MKILQLKTTFSEIDPKEDIDQILEQIVKQSLSLSDIPATLNISEAHGTDRVVSKTRKLFFDRWGPEVFVDERVRHKGIEVVISYHEPREMVEGYNDLSRLSEVTDISFDEDSSIAAKLDLDIFKRPWMFTAQKNVPNFFYSHLDPKTVACVNLYSEIPPSREERKKLLTLATKVNFPVKEGRQYTSETCGRSYIKSSRPRTAVILKLDGLDESTIQKFFEDVSNTHLNTLGIDEVEEIAYPVRCYRVDLKEGKVDCHNPTNPLPRNKGISYDIIHRSFLEPLDKCGRVYLELKTHYS